MHRGGTRLRRRLATLAVVARWGSRCSAARPYGERGSASAPPLDRSVGERRLRARRRCRSSLPRTPRPGASLPLERSRRRRDAWARPAINFVGKANDWMRDFAANADGSYPFRPDMLETRKYFARAVVKAFAPATPVSTPRSRSPTWTPPSRSTSGRTSRCSEGGCGRAGDGRFLPDKPVTMVSVHRVLVDGARPAIDRRQLNRLHTRDGVAFATPIERSGRTMLGMRLGLRYPQRRSRARRRRRATPLPRAQVAYSLYKAKTLPPCGRAMDRATSTSGIVLPNMGPTRRAIVEWGLRYVGYPYVWAGEWGFDSRPSAFGGQPIAGFDCSGLMWWLMRADDGGAWDDLAAPPLRGVAAAAARRRPTWRGSAT